MRLLSAPDGGLFGSDWSWVVGGFLLRQDVSLLRTYTFLGGPFTSDFQIERGAVYAEVANEVADGWHLTLGARLERHLSDYRDSFGVSLDPEDDLFGGRILLEREIGGSGFVYAGLTQGYKSGGFGDSIDICDCNITDTFDYDPENNKTYE